MQIRRILAVLALLLMPSIVAAWGPMVGSGVESASSGLSKTSLVAWYDFGDATDAHASYDLTETGEPAYTAGPPSYGSATSTTSQHGKTTPTTGLTSAWPATSSDAAWVVRLRFGDSVANGNFLIQSTDTRYAIRFLTAGVSAIMNNVVHATSVSLSKNTWYTIAINYTHSTGTVEVYVSGDSAGSSSGTASDSAAAIYFGGTSSTPEDVDIDFMGFFNRHLTSDEIDFITDATTVTYANFD